MTRRSGADSTACWPWPMSTGPCRRRLRRRRAMLPARADRLRRSSLVPALSLALRSLWNRRTTTLLTVSAIAVSVALLLGVQMLRTAAREGFLNTLSGVDLIVGARTGPIDLLLYSVFRIGDATSEVSWKSYQLIAHHRDVAWTIPLSLGDSLRGFPVLGTDLDYFRHYRYAGDQTLRFAAGAPFHDLY